MDSKIGFELTQLSPEKDNQGRPALRVQTRFAQTIGEVREEVQISVQIPVRPGRTLEELQREVLDRAHSLLPGVASGSQTDD